MRLFRQMPSNTSTCEHGTSGPTDEVLTATHEQHARRAIIPHLNTNNLIHNNPAAQSEARSETIVVAAAGVDEVGCFSLARVMLPLPLSDIIRDRNSAHLRKRGRPPLLGALTQLASNPCPLSLARRKRGKYGAQTEERERAWD